MRHFLYECADIYLRVQFFFRHLLVFVSKKKSNKVKIGEFRFYLAKFSSSFKTFVLTNFFFMC